jgi:predicted AlkP superfamily phosphohydrolase/phosphomutase
MRDLVSKMRWRVTEKDTHCQPLASTCPYTGVHEHPCAYAMHKHKGHTQVKGNISKDGHEDQSVEIKLISETLLMSFRISPSKGLCNIL